jgi:hypothetical protein
MSDQTRFLEETDTRPDFRGFADHLRAEARWSALLHDNDRSGQAASEQRALYDLADQVEKVGKRFGFL